MESLLLVGQWLANAFVSIWEMIGTWGILGVCFISYAVLKRVGNLMKKIFQY